MPEAPKAPQKLLPAAKESIAMSFVSNALAIAGFIILTFIVMWGVVHVASLSNFSFSALFASSPKIEITVPKGAVSGQPATILWKLTREDKPGSFSFLYQCEQNFSFTTRGFADILNKVPCGASINVGSSTSATMIGVVVGTGSVSVPFSVIFTPADGSARVEGSAKVSVAPAVQPVQQIPVVQEQKPAQKPITEKVPVKKTAPVSSGPADLSVRIIATGYIDPASGALLMNRAPNPGDIVGVEFDIANIGGSPTGTWYFDAHLPTATPYTYTSPAQASLAPGAHIMNPLRFTQLAPGGGLFTAIANPSSQVNDANRTNNEAAQVIY